MKSTFSVLFFVLVLTGFLFAQDEIKNPNFKTVKNSDDSTIYKTNQKLESELTASKKNADSLKSAIKEMQKVGSISFAITLGGDIQNIMGASENSGGKVNNGSLGFKVIKKREGRDNEFYIDDWMINSNVSIATNNDTVSNNYGTNILIPKKGKTSIEISAYVYNFLRNTFLRKLDFFDYYGRLSFSSGIWRYQDSNSTYGSLNMTNISISTGISVDFIKSIKRAEYNVSKEQIEKISKYSCAIGLGLSLHQILGDLSFDSFTSLRKKLLNDNSKINYWGFEFFITLGYDDFSITGKYIFLRDGGEPNVPGLTKGQLLSTFNFGANINL